MHQLPQILQAGSKSASPWIWETLDRCKRFKRDKVKAEEQWFSAGMLLSEEVTNIDGAQFAGILWNHDVTLSRQVNSIDVKAKELSGAESWCTSSVRNVLCGDDTTPIQVTLWNECLACFEEQLKTLPTDTTIIMEMRTLTVSKMKESTWNGALLSAIQQIESLRRVGFRKGTSVKLTQASLP